MHKRYFDFFSQSTVTSLSSQCGWWRERCEHYLYPDPTPYYYRTTTEWYYYYTRENCLAYLTRNCASTTTGYGIYCGMVAVELNVIFVSAFFLFSIGKSLHKTKCCNLCCKMCCEPSDEVIMG